MTAALLCIVAAPLLALTVLWAWSHTIIGRQPQTVPEALVRVLWWAARTITGWALALEAGGLAYRKLISEHQITSALEEQRVGAKPSKREVSKALARMGRQ